MLDKIVQAAKPKAFTVADHRLVMLTKEGATVAVRHDAIAAQDTAGDGRFPGKYLKNAARIGIEGIVARLGENGFPFAIIKTAKGELKVGYEYIAPIPHPENTQQVLRVKVTDINAMADLVPFTSPNDGRDALQYVHIGEYNGHTVAAATDGYSLAAQALDSEATGNGGDVFIHAEAVKLAAAIIKASSDDTASIVTTAPNPTERGYTGIAAGAWEVLYQPPLHSLPRWRDILDAERKAQRVAAPKGGFAAITEAIATGTKALGLRKSDSQAAYIGKDAVTVSSGEHSFTAPIPNGIAGPLTGVRVRPELWLRVAAWLGDDEEPELSVRLHDGKPQLEAPIVAASTATGKICVFMPMRLDV